MAIQLFFFAAVSFFNALLLFLIQPMFAKAALPLLGGTPAVWTTCMLFFQAALLAGYLYAHTSTQLLGLRRQAALQMALAPLPMLVLPVAIGVRPPPGNAPPIV
jgi:glucan phosphoethanolaminetransferase (alkaline phosphatase superfamily)